MQHDFSLPRITGKDIVTDIRHKRAAAKKRKRLERCRDSLACDCPRCFKG